VRNWDHTIDRRRETIALDQVGNNGSDEFNRRMFAVNLTLRSGDGAPQPLKHMRQVMFGVSGPTVRFARFKVRPRRSSRVS